MLNITGRKFGRLTAKGAVGRDKCGCIVWVCDCECGSVKHATASALTRGRVYSCGCLQKESIGSLNRSHGMTGSRVYRVWAAMIARCCNPKHKNFSSYGARGITVCELWRKSFPHFLADMGVPPNGGELDRIDNDGHYSKENCRWASRKEQVLNRSVTRFVQFQGQKMCISDVAREVGMLPQTLGKRLRRGMSLEEAIIQKGM